MKLDCFRPRPLVIQRYNGCQGRHIRVKTVYILRIKPQEPPFLGKGGEHVVESRGLRLRRMRRQISQHVVEG